MNFSESGWNKIGHLWRWGRWRKNGSGKSDGTNLVRMRSILSLKKSRNVLARDDASGDSGSEFEAMDTTVLLPPSSPSSVTLPA